MRNCFPRRSSVNAKGKSTTALYAAMAGLTFIVSSMVTDPAAVNGQNPLRDQPVALQHADVTESSGIAVSHRRADRIWTHNDSGDEPRLFAFDIHGKSTGVWRFATAQAVDWEDMASFEWQGQSRLLVADVGDNNANRNDVQLYLFDEPDPNQSGVVQQVETIHVRFPNGPCDCEAVAVDVAAGRVWLASKRKLPICDLFVVPLEVTGKPVTAQHVSTVAMPMITAMDISADSSAMVLCGYFDAFVYRKAQSNDPWSPVLRRAPMHRKLPALKQVEAICFTGLNQVWIASEGSPGMMMQMTLPEKR